ncbi:MAG: YitT family protein [Schwartzia sp. (in: firmicutes)]
MRRWREFFCLQRLRGEASRYGMIFLGCLLCAWGYDMFLIPAHLMAGGISGIAIVLYYLMGWPVGIQLLVYNLPILVLAWRVFGLQYAMDTVIGTVIFSLCVDWLNFLSAYRVVGDIMLNAIFGGVLAGVGFGLIFRARANSGGLDVVGAVVKKYYSFDMGTAIFVLNIGIILLGVRLFDVETALFTLVSIYVTAALTNRVVAGFNREKQIFIVSPHAKEIAARIMARTGRGVTVFDGRGAFTGEHKDILFVIASLTQVSTVKFIVDTFDPAAFMIVSDTSEVMGRGFTLENHLQAAEKRRLEELQQKDASA